VKHIAVAGGLVFLFTAFSCGAQKAQKQSFLAERRAPRQTLTTKAATSTLP
jgi:hypothetical protein